MVDTYTRECLVIKVDSSIPGARVARVLEQISERLGGPERVMVADGPEFAGKVLDAWSYQQGIVLHFIEPGKANPEPVYRELHRQVPRQVLAPAVACHSGLAERL